MANQIAYGFVGIESLFSQRLTDVGTDVVETAIQASVAEHNRQINAMLDLAVRRTTNYKERFLLPGSGTLQPLDQYGVPQPVKVEGYADVAFPIQGAGTAWGTNRVSAELMTVEEANRLQVMVQSQDADWTRRHILAALLDKNSWTFSDPDVGSLTIQPLANGDSQTYLKRSGVMATANHYIAQAAAIADLTNPFPTIATTLKAYPGNDGPFVAYVPSTLRSSIEGLAGFHPVGDPNIIAGIADDHLRDGIPGGVQAFGEEVIGYVDGLWIVVWDSLPDKYILAFATGAPDPALAMREYPAAGLQGLFPEAHSPNGNLMERRFIRYAGFGARNRTAALAYFVEAGDTTYDTPSGFETPLPV